MTAAKSAVCQLIFTAIINQEKIRKKYGGNLTTFDVTLNKKMAELKIKKKKQRER